MIFVRHAMPALDPAVPPTAWHLGDEGRAAARRLHLPPDAYLVASDEPKAVETLRYAAPGAPVHQDPGFAEVHRPAVWQPDHHTLARAYVTGSIPATALVHTPAPDSSNPASDHPRAPAGRPGARVPDGWEPPAEVVARFGAAVERHRTRAAGRPLVVATHGMALTCWLTAHALIAAEPARFWENLRFPDVIEIRSTGRERP
ncbi:histidine phosphatase family protein [Actinoplanes sp. NPDC000266]